MILFSFLSIRNADDDENGSGFYSTKSDLMTENKVIAKKNTRAQLFYVFIEKFRMKII